MIARVGYEEEASVSRQAELIIQGVRALVLPDQNQLAMQSGVYKQIIQKSFNRRYLHVCPKRLYEIQSLIVVFIVVE